MTDADRPADSAQPSGRPLRLSIGLLLLWTTTTALALGLASGLARSRDASFDAHLHSISYQRMLRKQDLLWFMAAPAYGAALAAAVVAAYKGATQQRDFPTQPGHWLAVLLGIGTLGFFATMIPDTDGPTQRLVATAVIITLAVVGCLAASSTPGPRRWRSALVVNAAGLCALVAVMIAGRASELDAAAPAMWMLLVLPALAIAVAVAMAAFAAAVDLVRPPSQGLFHWAGILTLAVLVAHPAIALSLLWNF